MFSEYFAVDNEEFGLACMLAFGYRIDEQREKTRQDMKDIVQWF